MKLLVLHTDSTHLSYSNELSKDNLFAVETVHSLSAISEKIHLYDYDCILVYTQENNGIELVQKVTGYNKSSGLILLAPHITVQHKVNALNNGADDCLEIPYHSDELKARILAIIRRKKFNAHHQIHFANAVIDLDLKRVLVWNTPVSLTPKEYDIFLYLIMNKNKTVSHTMLAEYLWGDAVETIESPNLLVSHIKNLRKKLKLAKAEIEIKNSYAVGYQLIEL